MNPRLVTALATVPALALLAACGGSDAPAGPTDSPAASAPATPGSAPSTPTAPTAVRPPRVIGTVASNLEVPWGIAFLPDGAALVTERDSGRVLEVRDRKVTPIGKLDETRANAEAGLLGVAVSPTFATDQYVFVYTSTSSDNRVIRLRYEGGRLFDPTPILTGIPVGFIHDGGRMAFGPDGFLYVSTGERGEPPLAQDPDSLGGKILRITADGRPAAGNPDPSSPVFSSGHRNVQGLAFDDAGRLWASEFGQNTFDELNLVEAGKNYGWPEVEGKGGGSRYTDPQQVWATQDASPSGLAFLDGHLWMAALRGERLWRVTVDGGRAVRPKGFFVGKHGRMRAVAVAPDGNLWVTTSNRDGRGDPQGRDDRILLVDPGTF